MTVYRTKEEVHSHLWKACGLPRPGAEPDGHGGYSIEVNQCDWGHVARKKTWLYLVGVPRSALALPPAREPTHQIGVFRFRDSAGRLNWRGDLKQCSAQQRRRTPPAFAEWLVSLARVVKGEP